ncbi:hypothetical protein AB8613_12735 [Vibrio sp. BS-M-Sm-2]|uniref:hypothetical protein n=1 Tax=Vibrio sp. BS-M-Sm-2 TaxID=3241167 RepID=UPI003557625E
MSTLSMVFPVNDLSALKLADETSSLVMSGNVIVSTPFNLSRNLVPSFVRSNGFIWALLAV